MNSRERVHNAVQHKKCDRIPVAEHFWEDTVIRWRDEGLPNGTNPDDYFDFDIIHAGVDTSPRFTPELIDDDGEWRTIRDRFGYVVRMVKGKSRTMDYISYPAPDRDLWEAMKPLFRMSGSEASRIDKSAYPFRLEEGPSWDEARKLFTGLRQTDKYLLATSYGPHEAVWRMHGFTETLYDFILDPELIKDMAAVYTDFFVEVIERIVREGIVIDGFMIVEDIASTRGMLFSPEQWRDIYKAQIEKIGKCLRENGIHFWMHSCGNCKAVFEDLIECGLQVINPLEAKSGLDVRVLIDKYKNRLAFYGNLDVIRLAESDEAARDEILSKLTVFGNGGGYIAHSDHSIPPEIPLERYSDIVRTIKELNITI